MYSRRAPGTRLLPRIRFIDAVAFAFVFASASAVHAAGPATDGYTLDVDPMRTFVMFTLAATAHTVEGKAPVEASSFLLDPATGEASGRVVVEVASLDTGNATRDSKMRSGVLDADSHPQIVFGAERVVGELAPAGESPLELHGVLSIHGADHPVILLGVVRIDGAGLTASASFKVPYVEWGMADPSFLFFRVAKSVVVDVELAGTISPAPVP